MKIIQIIAVSIGIWLSPKPACLAQLETVEGHFPGGIELDFGFFDKRGIERYDTLLIHNPTEAPFVVENIRPSCGCTAVDWPVEPLAPGETVKIPVAFRCTKGGYVEKSLDVFFSHLRGKQRIYVLADCPKR